MIFKYDVPIHKNGDEQSLKNYCSVSIFLISLHDQKVKTKMRYLENEKSFKMK